MELPNQQGPKEKNMKSATPALTRRLLLCAIASSSLLASMPALALGNLADVNIINRDSGEVLRLYKHRGDVWVAGEPGARYAVEIYNASRGRLLNVVSVDGINAISGETAAFEQTGYVIEPGQRYDVSGWRKSSREIAAFEFTKARRSYAARTDRPDDVGVIGVAVFREEEDRWDRDDNYHGRSGPAPKSGDARGKSMPWNGPGPQLGTGHGDRERDRVGKTTFERRSDRPDEIIRIRYDSRANLIAAGIIPRREPRGRQPSPFPGERPQWAPDPWR